MLTESKNDNGTILLTEADMRRYWGGCCYCAKLKQTTKSRRRATTLSMSSRCPHRVQRYIWIWTVIMGSKRGGGMRLLWSRREIKMWTKMKMSKMKKHVKCSGNRSCGNNRADLRLQRWRSKRRRSFQRKNGTDTINGSFPQIDEDDPRNHDTLYGLNTILAAATYKWTWIDWNGNPNLKDEWRYTPLLVAATGRGGRHEVVGQLLSDRNVIV